MKTSHDWCQLPCGGLEHQVKKYEVLVSSNPQETFQPWLGEEDQQSPVAVGKKVVDVKKKNAPVDKESSKRQGSLGIKLPPTKRDVDSGDSGDEEDADLAEETDQSLQLDRPPSTLDSGSDGGGL